MTIATTVKTLNAARTNLLKKLAAMDKEAEQIRKVLGVFATVNVVKDNYLDTQRRPFVNPNVQPITIADYIRHVLRQHPGQPMSLPDILQGVQAARGKTSYGAISVTLCNMQRMPTSGIAKVRHGFYRSTD